ncbi:MAG: shikimate dehydrogenase [Alphaproteobacteria bacterium]|nr:MAG: shikimate dehydrogenase [Alphaproteobacteria bacterium]
MRPDFAARGEYGPIAAVIGWPIGHSLSPPLHRYWLQAEGIAGEYVALAVRPGELAEAMKGLAALGFAGANVTIPHKREVLALVDRVDPLARRVGAANLVLRDGRGRWLAMNSDVIGVKEALCHAAPDPAFSSTQALVLGAGGAARAVVVALLDLGMKTVVIANRRRERAEELVAGMDDSRLKAIAWHERSHALVDTGLLVNATSLGMQGHPPLTLDLSLLPASAVVFDLVYRPLRTALLQEAERRGLVTVDGLAMLIHQAVPAFAAFYGRPPGDVAGARQALHRHLQADRETEA